MTGITAPCGQDTIPYGSKPWLWKIIVYSNYCWGKKRKKKTNISQFSATHTYIKHLLAFFPFFCAPFPYLLFCCFAPTLPITEKFHFHLICCRVLIFIGGNYLSCGGMSKCDTEERRRDVLRGDIAGDIIKWNVFSRFTCLLHFDWLLRLVST